MIHGQLWFEFGHNLSACKKLALASGISIWSVIIVAKICGIVRDQVADFCQSLCWGFSWVFSCYELTMFFDPPPPQKKISKFFLELYMVIYILSLGPWKLHTQEFHWSSRKKKIGKKNTSPSRIKDTDLDEGTAFPFKIPSWDSHGVKLHLVFAIVCYLSDLHSGVKFSGLVNSFKL